MVFEMMLSVFGGKAANLLLHERGAIFYGRKGLFTQFGKKPNVSFGDKSRKVRK